MTRKSPKNIAASIKQRLLNKRKDEGRTFDEIMQYYAIERFLYRLSLSEYKNKFILKGAIMLRVWKVPFQRTTMDIDMCGKIDNNPGILENIIRSICTVDIEDDGLLFDPSSIRSETITHDADYLGIRVLFLALLENSRINMQIDIGFGDTIYPSPQTIFIPSILDMSPPKLKGYTKETSIAEKFQAMVDLGRLNSRMKDFYDIVLLSRHFDFDGYLLSKAIEKTFRNRQQHIPEKITVFTPEFASDKQVQWNAFMRKISPNDFPTNFIEVTTLIRQFLEPVVKELKKKGILKKHWSSKGSWS